jgi:hypothetical protein
MNSTLPSRWQEILRREAAENVGNVLAQAKDQPDPRRIPRWTVPALAVGLASVSLLSINGGTGATGKGSVPFDRSTVISTRTAGLGASAEDLAPRREPSAAPDPVVEPSPAAAAQLPERAEPRRPPSRQWQPCTSGQREAARRPRQSINGPEAESPLRRRRLKAPRSSSTRHADRAV